MQISAKIVLAAVAALAGSAALAASLPAPHRLTVRLPDGGVEQISYTGDTAPKVTILPTRIPAGTRMATAPFWAPIADFDQISGQMDAMAAAMDRQMAAAMRGMDAFAQPNGLMSATLHGLPAGTESYSMVGAMSGDNACIREVQITSRGDGAKPEIVSHTSGNCGPGQSADTVTGFGDSPAGGSLIKAGLAAPPATMRQHI